MQQDLTTGGLDSATKNGPASEPPNQESDTPLFLRDGAEGKKGDAQDEKDKTGE